MSRTIYIRYIDGLWPERTKFKSINEAWDCAVKHPGAEVCELLSFIDGVERFVIVARVAMIR